MALEPSKLGWMAAILGLVAVAATGCETQAFCFACEETTPTTTTVGTGGSGGETCIFDCTGGGGQGGGTGGNSECIESNEGVETCDGLDNDCNDAVDDLSAEAFANPKSCGTCQNDCYANAANCKVDAVGCDPSVDPGMTPGTCTCGECATDYFNLDGDETCEYFCKKTADDDALCNNKDDDCDGDKDEDVDFCDDPLNCGKCGRTCTVLHGQGDCVKTGAGATCTEVNTECQILDCDCNGPGDCWVDLDKLASTGCEYQCQETNNGVEICDGLDNDCDGDIDSADDLSGDPDVGDACFGDPDGLCADATNAGVKVCQGGLIVCDGPDVLKEGQTLETCNGVDDDCDGLVDDNPTDVGGSCGVSAIFPCSLGTQQCVGGQLTCVGAVAPGMETCNGVDDDCDGNIDKTGNNPPADSVGTCNVPVPPPAGATSPCMAGMKACQGGQVVCGGSVGPTSANDSCGDDSNCDGVLTNQPNFQTDVAHCGNCMTNCQAGALHTIVACVNGMCVNQGCELGYHDLDNNGSCEYPCTFVSAQEACNGVDDDCDGQVDEGVVTPLPTQVCGVSPSAVSNECKPGAGGVQVACTNGSWVCTFPAGVCPGGCSPGDEICDGLDNDCDGLVNENVGNFGLACASDDGLPPPGHGACRTTGTFVCNGPTATVCSAMKADCAGLPGGCTELCDGVDNDCDGMVDETFNTPGTNAANFVKPAVTRIGASLWTYSYEASRPSATNAAAGSGNGFWTSAPAGATLDKTPACSLPNKIPWFNVTPQEVQQVCTAAGGSICTRAQFQTACTPDTPNTACIYGYNPRGNAASACGTGFTATKFCNLAPAFDFNTDPMVPGDQDGLLPTASSILQNCWADWSGLQSNSAATNKVYDLTGNLREITSDTNPAPCGGAGQPPCNVFRLMGGAFNTEAESGAACNFTFYTVSQTFKFFDTGFRCCFTQNPSP